MVVFHNDIINAIAQARNIRHLLASDILERWQQGEEATAEQTQSLIQLGDWIDFLTDAEQLVVEECIDSTDVWNIIQQIGEQAIGLDCVGTNYNYNNPAPIPIVPVGQNYVESVTGLNTNNADPQNPVVRISVDGTTITGQGTPASPLVASIPPSGVQSVTDDGNGVVVVDNSDPANPIVKFNGVYVDGSTIGGDGTSSNPLMSLINYAAQNGITLSGTIFELGGALNQNTTIDSISYSFIFLSSQKEALKLKSEYSTNNDAQTSLVLFRESSSTPANGIGNSIDIYNEVGIGLVPPSWVQQPDVRVSAISDNSAPNAGRASRYELWINRNNNLYRYFQITSDGQLIFDAYDSSGNFIDTPTYALGVDASGNVIQFTPSSGAVTSVTATLPITSSGGATPNISTLMKTNRLIGRTSSGNGEMEEITVGSGLTLSGGSLSATGSGVTSVTATSPLLSSGGSTPDISLPQVTGAVGSDGYLSATDWLTFNSKQNAITLTTTGTSGAATFIGNTLNIPQYSGGSASPLTTKGDLYTHNSTVDARLPIGLDTQILMADSTTATGLKWASNTTPPASGYYGAFQDNVTQTAAVSNVGYAMILRTTDLSNGVTVVTNGTNLTRITFANTGIYNLQFSSQFQNASNADADVTIWLRKNSADVTGSAGFIQVPKRISAGAGNEGHIVVSWNYLLSIVGGEYYEIVWSTTDAANITMQYYPAGSPPPSTASVIVAVTQQAGILAGTGITAINSLTGAVQTMGVGTSGTDFAISSSGTAHTFNLPIASATNTGKLSAADWTTFNSKEPSITAGTTAQYWRGDKSWQTLDKTAVGLGNVDNTSDATKNSATATLTNKRITARTGTVASSATPTINTDNVDYYSITALAVAITSMTTNLSGTPTTGQTLWISITDNGTARAITWGASFEASGNVALPTTTVISTRLDVAFIWNEATSKWRCVGVA